MNVLFILLALLFSGMSVARAETSEEQALAAYIEAQVVDMAAECSVPLDTARHVVRLLVDELVAEKMGHKSEARVFGNLAEALMLQGRLVSRGEELLVQVRAGTPDQPVPEPLAREIRQLALMAGVSANALMSAHNAAIELFISIAVTAPECKEGPQLRFQTCLAKYQRAMDVADAGHGLLDAVVKQMSALRLAVGSRMTF